MEARKQAHGGRRGGGQPSPVLRRRGAARRRRGRAAARLQHGDLRRGAPAAGDRQPVLRREPCRPRSCSSCAATRGRRRWRTRQGFRGAGQAALRRSEKAARDLRLAFPQDSVRMALAQSRANRTTSAPALDDAEGKAGGADRAAGRPRPSAAKGWRSAGVRVARTGRHGSIALGRPDGPKAEVAKGDQAVRWVEVFQHSLQLQHDAAVDRRRSSKPDRGHAARLDLHLGHAVGEAGLHPLPGGDGTAGGAHGHDWDSPFDYEQQGLLYVPNGLPEPNSRGLHRCGGQAACCR